MTTKFLKSVAQAYSNAKSREHFKYLKAFTKYLDNISKETSPVRSSRRVMSLNNPEHTMKSRRNCPPPKGPADCRDQLCKLDKRCHHPCKKRTRRDVSLGELQRRRKEKDDNDRKNCPGADPNAA